MSHRSSESLITRNMTTYLIFRGYNSRNYPEGTSLWVDCGCGQPFFMSLQSGFRRARKGRFRNCLAVAQVSAWFCFAECVIDPCSVAIWRYQRKATLRSRRREYGSDKRKLKHYCQERSILKSNAYPQIYVMIGGDVPVRRRQ